MRVAILDDYQAIALLVLSIITMGTTRVPVENVKALIDRAAGHL